MNSILSFNVQYIKPQQHVDESKLRIGSIVIQKCRFFHVIHKTSKKYFKQVDYDLKMEIVGTKYNGFDYYFFLYKIIDFSPYEFKDEYYINSKGIKIHKEPFIYGFKQAGFPDLIHRIVYEPKNIVIKRSNIKTNRDNEKSTYNLKNNIALQIKTGIQRTIDNYYTKIDSPSKRSFDEENSPKDIIVKRRKSLDEFDDENNSEFLNIHKEDNFIEDFIEKSKLTKKKKKQESINQRVENKKKIDVKLLYKQILAKHGRS